MDSATPDPISRLPRLGALIRGHFLGGLLVVLPLVTIAWILGSVLDTLWQLRWLLPDAWRPETYFSDPAIVQLLDLAIVAGVSLLAVLAISLVGWSSKRYLGRKLLELIGELIAHIPVIRSIYGALDQLLRTVANGNNQQFSRVVYIEYPRRGCWALAFVTGPARGPAVPPGHLNVYVPTTPNPTSGFHLLVPETEVRESQLRVEEAFRTILSLGIAQPTGAASGGSQGTSLAQEPVRREGSDGA